MKRWLAGQQFTLALLGLCALAWLFPEPGRRLNHGGWGQYVLIALTFFLTGTALQREEAIRGARAWRVHLFIQGFVFAVIPAAVWLVTAPFKAAIPEGLLLGLVMLSVLPTTNSSCVVFTQIAGGNVAAAIFNAVLATAAGVFLCPWLLELMVEGMSEVEIDRMHALMLLGQIVLAPLALGCIAGKLLPDGAGRRRKRVSAINSGSVLTVVWFAFCELFGNPPAAANGSHAAMTMLAIVPGHLVMLGAAWWLSGALKFNREDRIAIVFCAPQKTLSMGLPLIAACLAGRPELIGIASLPAIIYHPVQLAAAGIVKDRLAHGRGRKAS